jgi:glycosyltransferase involved in cell wall biosynthesis
MQLVSVIVPVLGEEHALPGALDRLARLPGRFEVIVVDGGSADGTVDAARARSVRVLTTPPLPAGRAAQLNAAAATAAGDVLLFLHADTALPHDAYGQLTDALADRHVCGGNFALRFDGDDRVYYGDSAVFVRREVFANLAGFRPLPIMDDYDFVRRLERYGPTVCVPSPAVTSARRWKALGIPHTLASWVLIQTLFAAGVGAERLSRLYGRPR